jgi:dynamin 1-like protein
VPIIIKIFARDVIDLTLVDLPGICKNPTGDQPPDIEQRILEIIYQYASSPMALIMAVSPANQDVAISDGLKIAKQIDPEGERTIGVLTKIDIMDEGVDALDLI